MEGPEVVRTKRSVAVLIRHPDDATQVLLVQRPDDDEDLPGVWGLPAATLRDGETRDDAARRAARDKLGVDIDVLHVLNSGSKRRADYRLDMDLVAARLANGAPDVDRDVSDGVTRYRAWRWGPIDELRPAAERGSLCSRLALETGSG